jgi:hypothetical protein
MEVDALTIAALEMDESDLMADFDEDESRSGTLTASRAGNLTDSSTSAHESHSKVFDGGELTVFS